jgi:hypothetical protein
MLVRREDLQEARWWANARAFPQVSQLSRWLYGAPCPVSTGGRVGPKARRVYNS